MRVRILFVLLFSGALQPVMAQQDPQFTMPQYNQLMINPATAGSRSASNVSLQGRVNLNGMNIPPINWSVGVDFSFKFGKEKKDGMGLGVLGYGDYIGYMTSHGLRMAFSYNTRRVGPGQLSIGMDFGIATKRINNAQWVTPGPVPDPSLPPANVASECFDMGAGVYYSHDNYYAGVSVLHLTASSFTELKMRQARQMYINGGGFIPVGKNKNWRLNPNGIVRTDFAAANFDIGLNALCYIKEKNAIIFGATYRFIDAVSFNVGYARKMKDGYSGIFMIGYSCDLITSKILPTFQTNHEIVLRYFFRNKQVSLQRAFF